MKLNLGAINAELKNMPPTKIIFLTLLLVYILKKVGKVANRIKRRGLLASLFRAAVKWPIVKGFVQKEKDKSSNDFK
jgi:hypothetical protein